MFERVICAGAGLLNLCVIEDVERVGDIFETQNWAP
jgi:hypothetical protein